MDCDFQGVPRELTWREREVMIRDGHRRRLAAQHRAERVAVASERCGTACDPIDELADLFEGFAE